MAPSTTADTLVSGHPKANMPAPSTFTKFPNLPVEIRIMIWKLFYRPQRKLVAALSMWREGRYPFADPTTGENQSIYGGAAFTMWNLNYASSGEAAYYHSIDNGINKLSRDIAHATRPSFWFPQWQKFFGTSWHPCQYSHSTQPPRITRINFDLDLVCLRYADTEHHMEAAEISPWWMLVKHLAIIDIEVKTEKPGEMTPENMFLWSNRYSFQGLRSFRRVYSCNFSRPEGPLGNEVAYFQTRHLLRHMCLIPRWRHLDCKQSKEKLWPYWEEQDEELPEPNWSQFVGSLQRGEEHFTPGSLSSTKLSRISQNKEDAGAWALFEDIRLYQNWGNGRKMYHAGNVEGTFVGPRWT